MSESIYNNFVQQYETVRKVLKDMYVYGCYKNTMYEQRLGIKLKTYEKELQRLKFYINDDNRVENRSSHWKVFGFSYDRYRNSSNYLITSYQLKTYTQKFLLLYFSILQILNSEKEEQRSYSLKNLALKLSEFDIMEDEKELGRKINEMISAGLIHKVKTKNSITYQLTDNILDHFDREELVELYYALDLYSNKSMCSVPAIFMRKTIKSYLKLYHEFELSDRNVFVFEYNFLYKILNDNIVTELQNSIDNRQYVRIGMYQNPFSSQTHNEIKKVAPCRILCEYWYGRQYLLGVDMLTDKAVSIRIDRIQEVTVLKERYRSENTDPRMKAFEHSWCVTLPAREDGLIEVEIDFYYDNDSKYIRNILEDEKKWGAIEDIGEDHCLFRIEVNDPTEIKPWIRRFGEHARVRHSEQHQLAEELSEDWKEALIKYGIISKE